MTYLIGYFAIGFVVAGAYAYFVDLGDIADEVIRDNYPSPINSRYLYFLAIASITIFWPLLIIISLIDNIKDIKK